MPDLYVYEIDGYKVIDGDTTRVTMDRGWRDASIKDCRIFGVDTPEKSGREKIAGKPVTRVVEALLAWLEKRGHRLFVRSRKKGKYEGRFIGDLFWVYTDDRVPGVEQECHLTRFLLDTGLCKPYAGRGKTPDFSEEECEAIVNTCDSLLQTIVGGRFDEDRTEFTEW
jgi:endonuclease YncB( thermonuclease family)